MRITTDASRHSVATAMKEYPVENLVRDPKLLHVYEGTSQFQRVVITRDRLKG